MPWKCKRIKCCFDLSRWYAFLCLEIHVWRAITDKWCVDSFGAMKASFKCWHIDSLQRLRGECNRLDNDYVLVVNNYIIFICSADVTREFLSCREDIIPAAIQSRFDFWWILLYIYIYICCFNFDALVHKKAEKLLQQFLGFFVCQSIKIKTCGEWTQTTLRLFYI